MKKVAIFCNGDQEMQCRSELIIMRELTYIFESIAYIFGRWLKSKIKNGWRCNYIRDKLWKDTQHEDKFEGEKYT